MCADVSDERREKSGDGDTGRKAGKLDLGFHNTYQLGFALRSGLLLLLFLLFVFGRGTITTPHGTIYVNLAMLIKFSFFFFFVSFKLFLF